MHSRYSVAALAAALALASPAAAQSFKTKKVSRPEIGLQLKMIKALNEVALERAERQIKVAWSGKETAKVDRKKTDVEFELGWFEIDRTKPRVDDGPRQVTLNGANTLQDFLFRRSFDDPDDSRLRKVVYDKKNKAPKYGRKGVWQAWEIEKTRKLQLRVWFVESETEIFGLYARSKQTVAPFVEFIERKLLKTIKRTEPQEVEMVDPYVDSDLPYLDARRVKLKDLPRSWRKVDTPNFLILTPIPAKGKAGTLVDTIAKDLEIMRKVYEARFPPEKPIEQLATVRIFGSMDGYQAFVKRKGSGGLWMGAPINELLLPNPAEKIRKPLSYRKGVNAFETLYHEAMHQYFSYRSDAPAPLSWFNEGYGEHFGGSQLNRSRGELVKIGVNLTRWKIVRLQVKNDAAPPLEKLVRMEQKDFYGTFAGSNYAFGWAFCHFLERERAKGEAGNQVYASIPDRYLANLGKMGNNQAAIEATFKDIDFGELQTYWLDEMKTWKDPK